MFKNVVLIISAIFIFTSCAACQTQPTKLSQATQVDDVSVHLSCFWDTDNDGEPDVGGWGSGVLIDRETIYTAGHVLYMCTKAALDLKTIPIISVYGHDWKTETTLFAIAPGLMDSDHDFGIVKIKIDAVPADQKFLPLAPTAKDLKIGDPVITFGGNPAYDRQVVFGEIRHGVYEDGYFMISSIIYPGFSGGPVFNTRGQIIGINIATPQKGAGPGIIISVDKIAEIKDTVIWIPQIGD